MKLRLTLPYPPSLNHLYPTRRGRRVKSREYQRYCLLATWALSQQAQPDRMLLGDVRVRYDFYMPRRADLDNRIKAVQDVLTGLAWKSDMQVADIRAIRHKDKLHPRVEVEIEQIEEVADGDKETHTERP